MQPRPSVFLLREKKKQCFCAGKEDGRLPERSEGAQLGDNRSEGFNVAVELEAGMDRIRRQVRIEN